MVKSVKGPLIQSIVQTEFQSPERKKATEIEQGLVGQMNRRDKALQEYMESKKSQPQQQKLIIAPQVMQQQPVQMMNRPIVKRGIYSCMIY
jgi:hypothetical protein